MNHSEVQKRMADYLEGDLPLDRRALFDAHLDGCAECRSDMEQLRAIPQLLSQLPDVEPPPTLTSDVMRRIRLGEAAPTFGDRLRTLFYEISTPGIAIPVSAMLAALVFAVASGEFRWELPADGAGHAQTAALRQLPPIPPAAAARARQAFQTTRERARQLNGGSDATLVASKPRAYLEVLPAATGNAGSAPAGQRRVRIYIRPSLGASFADLEGTTPSSADDWLAVVLQQPAEFARRQASLTLAEREHWVRALARRAAETNSVQAVLDSLRHRGGPEASQFAAAFEVEAGRTSAQIATSR